MPNRIGGTWSSPHGADAARAPAFRDPWIAYAGLSSDCSLLDRFHRLERLIEVADDVVAVLDADAEPDHFGCDARVPLLVRRHLSMRGGGRMARQRLRVAE